MAFDLIAEQEVLKEITDPRKLYERWALLCGMADRKEISLHMLDELSPIVYRRFRDLEQLKKALNPVHQ